MFFPRFEVHDLVDAVAATLSPPKHRNSREASRHHRLTLAIVEFGGAFEPRSALVCSSSPLWSIDGCRRLSMSLRTGCLSASLSGHGTGRAPWPSPVVAGATGARGALDDAAARGGAHHQNRVVQPCCRFPTGEPPRWDGCKFGWGRRLTETTVGDASRGLDVPPAFFAEAVDSVAKKLVTRSGRGCGWTFAL